MSIPNIKLTVPDNSSEILLHSCCAPCSTAIIECLLNNNIRPTIFYFNPNIYPYEEYEKRKSENKRYADGLGLTLIDGDYDYEKWKNNIRGLEDEPERGKRCLKCFKLRMNATAHYAHTNGLSVFTTTLASSRWKLLPQISEAGREAASLYDDIIYWEQSWRKGGLSERKNQLIALHDFYNQQYCGCEFSLRDRKGINVITEKVESSVY